MGVLNDMDKKERLFLLNELNEIEGLIRRKKEVDQYPFIKIFDLHLKSMPPGAIAKRVKIKPEQVSAIIKGIITIPRSKVNPIKMLGYSICSCCKKRVVPLEPVDYTTLTTLCAVCWKSESCREELKVDRSIPKGMYK